MQKPKRIDAMIDQVEQGQPVDLQRVGQLLDLDTVKVGEDFAQESLDRQEAADAELIGR